MVRSHRRRRHSVPCLNARAENNMQGIEEVIESKDYSNIQRLTDLAAKATGKYLSCTDIENHSSRIEDFLLKKVVYHAFPQDLDRAEAYAALHARNDLWTSAKQLVNEGAIKRIHQVGFVLAAVFAKKDCSTGMMREDTKVSLTFEKQELISATCMMCQHDNFCVHIIAAFQYRIRFPDKVPCYAPMTDALSVLTREQLQKLIQFAVNKDPAGMLGRVFEHYDAVRDPTSDMSKESGAPDPTFIADENQEQLYNVRLKQYTKNMEKQIMSSTPDNDENIKDENPIAGIESYSAYKDYFKHIRHLCALNELQSASTILRTLVDCFVRSFRFEQSVHDAENPEIMNMHLAELERIVTCFILTYRDAVAAQLVEMATSVGIVLGSLGAQLSYRPNEWVTITSIRLQKRQFGREFDIFKDEQNVLSFCQPVYARLLPCAHTSLNRLLNGEESLSATSYDEPLNVMLLRFDAISLFSIKGQTADEQTCRLGIVILRKLLKLSLQYSIQHEDDMFPCKMKNVTNTGNASCDGPSPAKRQHLERNTHSLPKSEEETQVVSYSKGQLSYSLMYVCCKLYKISDILSICIFVQDILFNATLRAIEMGRFKDRLLHEKVIAANEYYLLEKMESVLLDAVKKLTKSGNFSILNKVYGIGAMHASALENNGMDFYKDSLALSFIYIVVKLATPGNRIVLSLCTKAFLAWDWQFSYITDLPREKWKYLFNSILDMCITDGLLIKQKPVEQVLKHIANIKDGHLAHVLLIESSCADHFKSFPLKLKTFYMQSLVQSLTPREGSTVAHECTSQKQDLFVEYAKHLKAREYLEFILPSWNTLYHFFDKDFIYLFNNICKKLIQRPEFSDIDESEIPTLFTRDDVAMCKDLIRDFYKAQVMHTVECCFFLEYFSRDLDRKDLLDSILENSSMFSLDSLMEFAKIEHRFTNYLTTNESSPKSTLSTIGRNRNKKARKRKCRFEKQENFPPLTFSETVFSLITCMFQKIECTKQSIDDCEFIGYHIEWCVGKIAYKPCASQADIFLKQLHQCVCKLHNKHLIIVSVLEALSAIPDKTMWNMARELFKDQLLLGYFDHFESRIQNIAPRPRSVFCLLERDFAQALDYCEKHVNVGRYMFIMSVATPLKMQFKRKRNVCKVIEEVLRRQAPDREESSDSSC